MATSGQKNWNPSDNARLEQFIAVTGASKEAGRRLLEACNGNLDMAIGMFMDNNGSVTDIEEGPSTSSSSAGVTGMATGGAEAMPGLSLPDEGDEVRAPIPQKKEVLMEENYPTYGFRGNRRRPPRSVFDGFRDFEAETRQQHEWAVAGPPKTKKRKTLEDLFRPPLDLMHKGTFQSARDAGTKSNRWMIVNIQNVQEFCCQALNRDVWSQAAVKSIIQEHFLFWQVYHDSEEGKRYTQFYKINKWPYIAILDPRTGENMAIWNKIDALTFCDLVTEFLSHHPSLDGALSPPAKKQRIDSIVEASEDSQMEAAIKASLAETQKSSKNSFQYISDSDSDSDLETFSDSESENGDVREIEAKSGNNSTDSKNTVTQSEKYESTVKSESNKSESQESEETHTSKDSCGAISNSAQSKTISAAISNKHDSTVTQTTNSSGSVEKSVKSGKALCKSSKKNHGNSDLSSVSESNGEQMWQRHLGSSNDPLTTLNIRFPDGKREQVKWPCSSKLFGLVQFVLSKGFSNERFELVTNFPRRRLSYMEFDDTLKQIGLHPQETVFVQER
ncbi:UBX domain-containing protein 7-like isoform X2 [Lineus longissimus]|uniref:UBX domain-containing protein 7-like isoform X2 n=1 Tax=Lineus longissimus TaxID=88925 RepID=UPI002B4F66A1